MIAVESRGIHPSSLTFSRVGVKPQTQPLQQNDASVVLQNSGQGERNRDRSTSAVSSVDEIEKALQDTGLTIKDNDSNPFANRRTRMALNAYTDHRNQPSKLLATAMITGFDDYA